MGATLRDIADQLRFDLGRPGTLAAAYLTVELEPAKVHVWTLLDRRDDPTEARIAGAERRLLSSFPGLKFDFTTVHLQGRDPEQFIPDGAHPVMIGSSATGIMEFFKRRMSSPTDARS